MLELQPQNALQLDTVMLRLWVGGTNAAFN